MEELTLEIKPNLNQIINEVFEVIQPYEKKYGKKIPIVAAGGIFTGKTSPSIKTWSFSSLNKAVFIARDRTDVTSISKCSFLNAKDGYKAD